MRREIDSALDHCLGAMRTGLSIDDVLAEYPEDAGMLRPLLSLAADVAIATPPSAPYGPRVAGQERMLAALAARSQRREGALPVAAAIKRKIQVSLRGLVAARRPSRQAAGLAILLLLVVVGGLLWCLAMGLARLHAGCGRAVV